jgi:uncharacterized protein YndB with AHSA1/START domain
VHYFDAMYQDIIPNERIVYTFDNPAVREEGTKGLMDALEVSPRPDQ